MLPWRSSIDDLVFKGCALVLPIPTSSLDRALSLEQASYPADEAASRESFAYRLDKAPLLFGALMSTSSSAALVGLICGTRTHDASATHASMEVGGHAPRGETLVIHSVVIEEASRRRGLARSMIQAYIRSVAAAAGEGVGVAGRTGAPIRRVVLLCKPRLAGLYESAGFTLRCVSPVSHGSSAWLEMHMQIGRPFASTRSPLRPAALAPLTALRWWQVDAFGAKSFEGNPAAVVLLPPSAMQHSPLDRTSVLDGAGQRVVLPPSVDEAQCEWLRSVAAEMNLSETAFVSRCQDLDLPLRAVTYELRWFTPTVEVALCGHATLGAAAALWFSGVVPATAPIRFLTASGVLRATRSCDGDGAIALDFPAEPPLAIPFSGEEVQDVSAGATIHAVLRAAFPTLLAGDITWIGANNLPDLLVEVSWRAFQRLTRPPPLQVSPDFALLANVKDGLGIFRGIVVTAALGAGWDELASDDTDDLVKGTVDDDQVLITRIKTAGAVFCGSRGRKPIDFVSRCFYPRVGVNEDPVTGSAHVGLCPHWVSRFDSAGCPRSHTLVGYQASERGGVVVTTLSESAERVAIAGSAAVVSEGVLWT